MIRTIKNKTSPEFAILMGVYNGNRYLSQQLRSILKQSEKNWRLYVSDDGSKDNSHIFLKKFQSRVGDERVKISFGPMAGFSKNFMQLLLNNDIKAEFYALSDQDDIWNPGKLAAAHRFFLTIPPFTPALYCGRTIFVDENNQSIGLSKKPKYSTSFKNALVQNIASGNTMVINDAARRLIIRCGSNDIYAHDWWLYLLISGVGGMVYYDAEPQVRYRQHIENQIGYNSSIYQKIIRLQKFFHGEFSEWNYKNIRALSDAKEYLTAENRATLAKFVRSRDAYGLKSLYYLRQSGVYRQNFLQNILLYVGAIMGRI